MTERPADITLPERDPELEIIGLAVGRALQDRGTACRVFRDDIEAVVLTIGRRTTRLVWDPARGALVDHDWPLIVHPAVHPELLPPPSVSPDRLTFRGDPGSRRIRMIERTVRELRRRGWTGRATAIGPVDGEWPDESFPDLTGAETLRLLASSRMVIDAPSDQEFPHLLTLVAIRCGYPVITSAEEPHGGGANVARVAEWSADAFCDAVLGDAPPSVRPVKTGIENLVDTLERALVLD